MRFGFAYYASKNVAYALISNARNIVNGALFKQIPAVSAPAQANAPLLISSVTVNSASTPLEPKLDYILTNVSGKSITAYSVRHVVLHSGQRSEGVILRTSISINSLLQAGLSEAASLGGEAFSEPVESIQLIVDFVEFEDGITWGSDRFKSAERLRGQRAGIREEADRVLKLINERGVNITAQLLAAEESKLLPPTGHSPEWSEGFREGINFKRGRLKRAFLKDGSSGIVNELQRSSAASARKQR